MQWIYYGSGRRRPSSLSPPGRTPEKERKGVGKGEERRHQRFIFFMQAVWMSTYFLSLVNIFICVRKLLIFVASSPTL
jgi:hypothetical protein